MFVTNFFSCNTDRDVDSMIKEKITEFYTVSEAKNYTPISYSDLDTIQNIENLDGSIIRLTAIMTHEFSAKANNGNTLQYSDTFDVTIFKDEVIAIPRGY